jgi:site-specific recombinase XerD
LVFWGCMANKENEEAKVRGVWEKVPGSGVWWIRFRDSNGKLRREKVGRKSDAIDLFRKRTEERRTGVKLPKNLRAQGIKFSVLCDAIETFSLAHHRDQRNILGRLKRVRPDFDEREADAIKPQDIDAWLTKNTHTPATSNRYRALFSLIFREALRNGKVTSNPARLVRQKHEDNGVIRWLTEVEDEALHKAVDPVHLPELDISLHTGMRLSEQFELRWNQIDFVRSEVRLSKTKNYSGRSIPMNSVVEAAFKAIRPAKLKLSSKVFEKYPREWWEVALAASGVVGYRWHDNRHTFCSRLAMRGVNLKVIQTLAGHKTIAMTARYAHLDDASLRSAVNSLVKGGVKLGHWGGVKVGQ